MLSLRYTLLSLLALVLPSSLLLSQQAPRPHGNSAPPPESSAAMLLDTAERLAQPGLHIAQGELLWTAVVGDSILTVHSWPVAGGMAAGERYRAPLAFATPTFSDSGKEIGSAQSTSVSVVSSSLGCTFVTCFTKTLRSVRSHPDSSFTQDSGSIVAVASPDLDGLRWLYTAQAPAYTTGSVRGCSYDPDFNTGVLAVTSEFDGEVLINSDAYDVVPLRPGTVIPNPWFTVVSPDLPRSAVSGTADSGILYLTRFVDTVPVIEKKMSWAWRERADQRILQAYHRDVISAAIDTTAETVLLRDYDLQRDIAFDSLTLSFVPHSLSIAIGRRDTAIVLIYEREGIRITRIDNHFNVLIYDSLISNTADSVGSPQGVWWLDTLRVIWQDNHTVLGNVAEEGKGDRSLQSVMNLGRGVRGANIVLPNPSVAAVPATAVSNTAALSAAPNPARHRVVVSYSTGNGSPRSLRLVDVLGRVVLERKIEEGGQSGSLELDCVGVPAGAYRLVLSTPLSTTSTQLILE